MIPEALQQRAEFLGSEGSRNRMVRRGSTLLYCSRCRYLPPVPFRATPRNKAHAIRRVRNDGSDIFCRLTSKQEGANAYAMRRELLAPMMASLQ